MKKVIVVENLLSDDFIQKLLTHSTLGDFQDSKVGQRVDEKQKILKDFFFPSDECGPIDSLFFSTCDELIQETFGVKIQYRERWKIGHYNGDKRGHYNLHTDTQGGMGHRQMSCVIALSNPDDYEGGELVLPELKRQFRLQKGSAILFDPSLMHGVLPVTSGERHTLLSFMFGEEYGQASGKNLAHYEIKGARNTHESLNTNTGVAYYSANTQSSSNTSQKDSAKPSAQPLNSATSHKAGEPLLTLITPNSGPGNQVVSIKEALLMGHYLKRKLVLPNIYQHYIGGKKVWPFNEIFEYTDTANVTFGIAPRPEKIHVVHSTFLDKPLKAQTNSLSGQPEVLVEKRKFRHETDYSELANIKNEVLCIKHLFNNTVISQCSMNGCPDCEINPEFEEKYGEICKNFDFSKDIRQLGDAFIKQHLTSKYAAIHLRYPDIMENKSFKEHSGFSEEEITVALEHFCEQNDMHAESVFIATNKPQLARKTSLDKFTFIECPNNFEHISFLEQYICCHSQWFLMSNYNDYSKIDKPHQRSTWSSFVTDYRKYKLNNENNLVLNTVLNQFYR